MKGPHLYISQDTSSIGRQDRVELGGRRGAPGNHALVGLRQTDRSTETEKRDMLRHSASDGAIAARYLLHLPVLDEIRFTSTLSVK